MPYDYQSKFESESSGPRYLAAARILHDAGKPEVWPLLPILFKSMSSIVRSDARSDEHFAEMVRVGLRASANLMGYIGFNPSDTLHSSIWDWIVVSTESENAQLAAGAIYSLELLGIPPDCVRVRLLQLLSAPAKHQLGKTGTCRAVAFRVLLRLDERTAILNTNCEAFVEFRDMVVELHGKLTVNSDNARRKQIESEIEWLGDAV